MMLAALFIAHNYISWCSLAYWAVYRINEGGRHELTKDQTA